MQSRGVVRGCSWSAIGMNRDLTAVWLSDVRPTVAANTANVPPALPQQQQRGRSRHFFLPMLSPLLEVRDLHVSFQTPDGILDAVRGLSFSLSRAARARDRRRVGFRQERRNADDGRVSRKARAFLASAIRGSDLLTMTPRELRSVRGRGIAMIFQNPLSSLHPPHTVGWQIIEMIRAHDSMTKAQARRRAIELLGLVGIARPERRVDDYPHHYSGVCSSAR